MGPVKLRERNAKLMESLKKEHEKYNDMKEKFEQLESTYDTLKQFLENKNSKVNIKKTTLKDPMAKKKGVVRKLAATLFNLMPVAFNMLKEAKIKIIHEEKVKEVLDEELKEKQNMMLMRFCNNTINKKMAYFNCAKLYYLDCLAEEQIMKEKMNNVVRNIKDADFKFINMAYFGLKEYRGDKNYNIMKGEKETQIEVLEIEVKEEKEMKEAMLTI